MSEGYVFAGIVATIVIVVLAVAMAVPARAQESEHVWQLVGGRAGTGRNSVWGVISFGCL